MGEKLKRRGISTILTPETKFMAVILTENREKRQCFREKMMNSVCDLLSLRCLMNIQQETEQQVWGPEDCTRPKIDF